MVFSGLKAGGHGWTNITRALAESINTFFYIVGGGYENVAGLGIDKIKEYALKFGLGNELGIDLPNEASGFVPDEQWKLQAKDEVWYIGDTYHVAIGQGDILVTPLQVAEWTAVVANGGTLYQPRLIKQFLDQGNNLIKAATPKILNQNFISQNNIGIIRAGMRQTVTTGVAKSLQTLPMPTAAKTGTAQAGGDKLPFAWVTTFAPYNQPQVVVTVMIEEGGDGSSVATPVAKDILNWWLANRSND
jgi:penicillin-binding protein 2